MLHTVALPVCPLLAVSGAGPRRFACPRLNEFRYPLDDRGASPIVDARAAPMRRMENAMASALGRHASAAPGHATPHAILVLSGGGPWGSFGAGWLAGWSAAAAHPRPAFDLVTGVSTGALQATYAFLGRTQDAALVQSYTVRSESNLVDRRGLLLGVAAGAFAGTRPLEARVRGALVRLYDPVAAEAVRGRPLLVGAVDALDGGIYAIDLTRIARNLKRREREDCYVGALMASAAVPVEFDRVEVGGRPYFDGGVRRSAFVTNIVAAAAAAMGGKGLASQLYVLVNGDPRAERIVRLAPGLVPTLARLRTLAVNQIEMSSIDAVARAAPPGFETYIASAEGHRCGASDAGPDAVFDPAFMRCLIADGRGRWAGGGDPWVRHSGTDHSPQSSPISP